MGTEWESPGLDMMDFLRRILLTAEEARLEDLRSLIEDRRRHSYMVRDKVVTIVRDKVGYTMEVRPARRGTGTVPTLYHYTDDGRFCGCGRADGLATDDSGALLAGLGHQASSRGYNDILPGELDGDDWIVKARYEGVALSEE